MIEIILGIIAVGVLLLVLETRMTNDLMQRLVEAEEAKAKAAEEDYDDGDAWKRR